MDGFEACKKVVNALKIASIAVMSWRSGNSGSASSKYDTCEYVKRGKSGAGIKEDLIRLSVGLENSKDIIEDFKQAFATLE